MRIIETTLFRSLKWTELESRLDEDGTLFLPGSGFTKAILAKCSDLNIPITTLLMFSSESNNAGEAFILASRFNEMSKLAKEPLKPPMSWSQMFGTPAPVSIFN